MTKKSSQRRTGKSVPAHRFTVWRRKYGMPDHGAVIDMTGNRISPIAMAVHMVVLECQMEARV